MKVVVGRIGVPRILVPNSLTQRKPRKRTKTDAETANLSPLPFSVYTLPYGITKMYNWCFFFFLFSRLFARRDETIITCLPLDKPVGYLFSSPSSQLRSQEWLIDTLWSARDSRFASDFRNCINLDHAVKDEN